MKYFALLTTYGEKVLAEATALGTKIELTYMAVGDGRGTLPAPDTKQTKLVNEKRRAAINTLFIDSVNTNQVIAEQVIPENEGGWWIREIGLFDKSGLLVAVANCPETYKPLLAEGSGRTQTIRMILIVSHTEAVTLKVDPAIVLATCGYVDDSVKTAIEAHVKSRNHPDATTSAKGFVQLADALSADNTKAITPKLATEINQRVVNAQNSANAANTAATNANNNANGRVPSSRKVNNKPLSADITLSAGDVGAYTKAETDTKVADAKKAGTDAQATANAANTAATNANNNANGRVPSTRKVNNKPLSADITLSAGDVGAYTKAETDNKVADAKKAGTDANTNANGRVPNTRKVNNKPLSADITLSAGDVGAYTKAETDTKVTDAKKAGTDAQVTANAANTAATNASNNANGRVPSGRKVNNKALTADIALNAGDVGAYTKAEVDSKFAAGSGLGYGQTWQNVKASRAVGTVYTNSTGKPIVLLVTASTSANDRMNGVNIHINGVVIATSMTYGNGAKAPVSAVIPHDSTYKIDYPSGTVSPFIHQWFELRS
ncbi:TPA: phage tail protein [Providencia stuartii]|uniref:phage tail protein n=1 Tax=Providencia stuartii TaxID=588 RepID=UPI00197D6BA8|nr:MULTISPECIES: phage tail protein [Providencia]MBN5561963.1 phage tail protein [Providencia stuartii]MBN5601808.1 phage tail protein [Providencia stuartii]MBN5605894.1 phage tail protein [Providencia stuartii]MCL8327145.1 phage tail protein [Providencia thailandensis]MDF4175690.1 phage tail protein [Providencia thailandensis]